LSKKIILSNNWAFTSPCARIDKYCSLVISKIIRYDFKQNIYWKQNIFFNLLVETYNWNKLYCDIIICRFSLTWRKSLTERGGWKTPKLSSTRRALATWRYYRYLMVHVVRTHTFAWWTYPQKSYSRWRVEAFASSESSSGIRRTR